MAMARFQSRSPCLAETRSSQTRTSCSTTRTSTQVRLCTPTSLRRSPAALVIRGHGLTDSYPHRGWSGGCGKPPARPLRATDAEPKREAASSSPQASPATAATWATPSFSTGRSSWKRQPGSTPRAAKPELCKQDRPAPRLQELLPLHRLHFEFASEHSIVRRCEMCPRRAFLLGKESRALRPKDPTGLKELLEPKSRKENRRS